MSTIPYFAYGSNMLTRRLRGRVPSAQPLGKAILAGHRLAWHKIGKDGSGKCDIAPDPGGTVWGVIFVIDPSEMPGLDAAEGLGYGYEKKQITVTLAGKETLVTTYQATRIDPDVVPWHDYKDYVLAGAMEHNLPYPYIQTIRAVHSVCEPDASTFNPPRNRQPPTEGR
jgi:hypothetical protein